MDADDRLEEADPAVEEEREAAAAAAAEEEVDRDDTAEEDDDEVAAAVVAVLIPARCVPTSAVACRMADSPCAFLQAAACHPLADFSPPNATVAAADPAEGAAAAGCGVRGEGCAEEGVGRRLLILVCLRLH